MTEDKVTEPDVITNNFQIRRQKRIKKFAEWLKVNSGQTVKYITARFAYDYGWQRSTTVQYLEQLGELGLIKISKEDKVIWVGTETKEVL